MERTAGGSLLRHPYLLHLRLGFNLLLSPIYLWGVLLAGGGAGDAGFWLGFLSLHLFLYGGTTAFNSYYDRDEGPIGGMLRPPSVDSGLLPFSLTVQALGLVPAALTGRAFMFAWILLFVVFTAYSHPLVRLKANPHAALLAIALGQGAIGFALGWLAVGDPVGLHSAAAVAGMATTALVVTGLYLVTQSYQVDEDRRRGDVTVAVMLGGRRSLLVALLPLGLGGALLVYWVAVRIDLLQAGSLVALFGMLGLWLLVWALRFEDGRIEANYRFAMRFCTLASVALSLFIVANLVR